MNESQTRQPKGTPAGGEFAGHARPDAEVSLTLPDPWEGQPRVRSDHDDKFETCDTFQEIDGVFLAFPQSDALDNIYMRWAAKNRGRDLRASGAAGTPTKLPEHNWFRDAQNVTELICIWDEMTEEPPGDGEATAAQLNGWLRNLRQLRDARLAELRDAGVVSPNLSFRR